MSDETPHPRRHRADRGPRDRRPAARRRADRRRQDRRRRARDQRRRRGHRRRRIHRHPRLRRHPPAHLGGGDPRRARPTPPWTTTSSRSSTPSRRSTAPRTSTRPTSPARWSASTPASRPWSTGRTSTTRPSTRTPRSARSRRPGSGPSTRTAAPTLSLADYWFESKIAIPGDDVRRVRDTYFSSDDGLLTMALATRGTGFCKDEVVTAEWTLARELGIPITVHVAMGRLAGRFGMVKQLNELGLLGPDTTYVHCCYFSDEEWQLVADTGGTISIAPQVETADGPRLAAGASRRCGYGLRPEPVDRRGDHGARRHVHPDAGRVRRRPGPRQRGRSGSRTSRSRGPADRARRCWRSATVNGAHVAGLEDRTGSLTPGKQADVVVLDAHSAQRGAGDRPGRRGDPVRRCLQRRHGHRRRRGPQARRQAGRRRGAAPGTWSRQSRDHLLRARPRAPAETRMTARHARRSGRRPRPRSRRPGPGAGFTRVGGGRRGTPAAVHTGFGLCALDPGGTVAAARALVRGVRSTSSTGRWSCGPRRGRRCCVPGDYGLLPVGWHTAGATGDGTGALGRHARAAAPGPVRRRHLRRAPFPTGDATPVPVDVRDPRNRPFGHIDAVQHGRRQADPGPARGVGEHAHGAARLQRHHRQDDGRLRPRRRADRRCSWCSTRPTASPGRTTTRSRRRTCFLEGEAEATFDGSAYRLGPGRRGVRRGRLRARLPQRRRRAAALAGDPGAAAARPPLVPVRPRLGLPERHGDDLMPDTATCCSWSAGPPGSAWRSPATTPTGGRRRGLTGRDAGRAAAVAAELGGGVRGAGARPGPAGRPSPPRWPTSGRSTTWCSSAIDRDENTVRRLRHQAGDCSWSR